MSYYLLFIISILSLFNCGESLANHCNEESGRRLLSEVGNFADKDDLISISRIEDKAISLSSYVQREDGVLSIKNKTGDHIVRFVDSPCREMDDPKCEKYKFVGYVDNCSSLLVVKLKYESIEYVLINIINDDTLELNSFPHFFANGKQFILLIENDEELGFAIQIWGRKNDKFYMEWQGAPHFDWQYVSYKIVKWIDDRHIMLSASGDHWISGDMTENFSINKKNNHWTINRPD